MADTTEDTTKDQSSQSQQPQEESSCVEPVVEPAVEPAEPVVESAVDPAVESAVESAVEPAVEPVVEPAVDGEDPASSPERTTSAGSPPTPPHGTKSPKSKKPPPKGKQKKEKGKQKKGKEGKVEEMDVLAVLQQKIATLEAYTPEEEESEEAVEARILRLGGDKADETLRCKYRDQLQVTRTLDRELLGLKKKVEGLAREKTTSQEELNKITTTKTKLETLCRELQKQNKHIIEESKARGEDEQTKRQELREAFQQTIGEITKRMEEHAGDGTRLLQENENLRSRILNLKEQIDLRNQQYEQQIKHKELELTLLSTKLTQTEDREKQDECAFDKYRDQIEKQRSAEAVLKSQLDDYKKKFDHFQSTLNKSHTVFKNLKGEMEKLTKKIKALEHENGILATKAAKSQLTLQDSTKEEQNNQKKLQTLTKQNDTLKTLCTTLRKEKEDLQAKLKELNNPERKDENNKENIAREANIKSQPKTKQAVAF